MRAWYGPQSLIYCREKTRKTKHIHVVALVSHPADQDGLRPEVVKWWAWFCQVFSARAFQCPSCFHSDLGAEYGGAIHCIYFSLCLDNSRSFRVCNWSAQFTAFRYRKVSFQKEISTSIFNMFEKHRPCRSLFPLRICLSCSNTYFSFVWLFLCDVQTAELGPGNCASGW